ncbi:MAG: O-antigen ligase family protein [Candidatus Binatia bacterium]
MQVFLDWWRRGMIAGAWLSIVFLGIGRVEFFSPDVSMSAWSISRTTFLFWLTFKLVVLARSGWAPTGLSELGSLKPLFWFFFAVTISLLPDFHKAGDYRYFFFGCAHALMLVDLFAAAPQKRWLPVLLAVLPLGLVVRGLVHDPSILNLSLSHRFGYPLDHPNTAGYLFAMSIPLGVFLATARTGWWRGVSVFSCASQIFALVLTFSRGAWLGWTAAMLYLAVMLGKWKYLTALMTVAAACLLVSPSVQDRLASVTRPHDDLAIRERLQRLTSALQLGMDHPILGVGYGRGRLKESLRPYLKGTILEDSPVLHTHNVYVELFAETGSVGLFAYLWLLGHTLLRLWRASRRRDGPERLLGLGLTASWIAAIVTGFGDVPFYHHETRIFFFTLFALAHMYAAEPHHFPPAVTRLGRNITNHLMSC